LVQPAARQNSGGRHRYIKRIAASGRFSHPAAELSRPARFLLVVFASSRCTPAFQYVLGTCVLASCCHASNQKETKQVKTLTAFSCRFGVLPWLLSAAIDQNRNQLSTSSDRCVLEENRTHIHASTCPAKEEIAALYDQAQYVSIFLLILFIRC